MSIGQELLNVPMGDMIRDMAFAIAEAQVRLDESSIEVAEMMGGLKTVYDDNGNIAFDDSRVFFGQEYMTPSEAEKAAVFDDALSGSKDNDKLQKIIQNYKQKHKPKEDELIPVPSRVSMLELGFTPVFYNFVDTIIEVKIAIKITRERSYNSRKRDRTTNVDSKSKKGGIAGFITGKKSRKSTVSTSQVDASYSSKYGYSAEGSSLLRTKLSPVPPPAILEERIRNMMEDRRQMAAEKEEKPAT